MEIERKEIEKIKAIRMKYMIVIPIRKIQFLIRKNKTINFSKLMVTDFGLDIYPLIPQECLVVKMPLGILFQD